MKTFINFSVACLCAVLLASCGGSIGSSSGCFGKIPATIANYEKEYDEAQAKINENNYGKISKKMDELKAETKATVEEEAKALNGKEVTVSVDETQLKIEQPVTLVFDSMNKCIAMFGLDGKVVAATDLKLNADPSDLKEQTLLSGSKITVTVKMPVGIEFLDKDGNVMQSRKDIGELNADNLGSSAVVKAGTPLEFKYNFPVDEAMEGVESLRLVIDLSRTPYYVRDLN